MMPLLQVHWGVVWGVQRRDDVVKAAAAATVLRAVERAVEREVEKEAEKAVEKAVQKAVRRGGQRNDRETLGMVGMVLWERVRG